MTRTHTRTQAASVRDAEAAGCSSSFSILTFCTPTAEHASLHSLLSLNTTEAPRTHLARHTHTHPGCERGSSPYASAAYPRIQQKWEETLKNKLEGSQTPTTFPASFAPSSSACLSPPLFPGAGWLKAGKILTLSSW